MELLQLEKIARQADEMIVFNPRKISKINIKNFLLSRKPFTDEIFWRNGVIVWAVSEFSHRAHKEVADFNNCAQLNRKQHHMQLVDDALYQYSIYNQLSLEEKNETYRFLAESNHDSSGSIYYRPWASATFIDTIGMIAPYLSRYSAETGNKAALELGLAQFRAFFAHGFDKISGLPYHGYSLEDGLKCGIIGWGRGVGWLLVGLVEFYSWLPQSSPVRQEIKGYLDRLFQLVISYQREDGGFSWQLQATEGALDTSAVAMIGYSLAKYNSIEGRSDFLTQLIEMNNCILENIDKSGLVHNSSSECGGFSIHPQQFTSNSWGQAFSLLFLLQLG